MEHLFPCSRVSPCCYSDLLHGPGLGVQGIEKVRILACTIAANTTPFPSLIHPLLPLCPILPPPCLLPAYCTNGILPASVLGLLTHGPGCSLLAAVASMCFMVYCLCDCRKGLYTVRITVCSQVRLSCKTVCLLIYFGAALRLT